MKINLLLGLLLCLASTISLAQGTISGTVTSAEDGLPIPGVTVLVQGTIIGNSTDLDGRYSINVLSGSDVLVFRFVGLATQEISVNNRSVVNVVMEPETTDLS